MSKTARQKKLDNLTRCIVLALTHTQVQLEIMDDVKETKFYRHSIKNNLNKLEKDLESILTGELADVYIKDSQQFITLGKHIQYIAEWVADSSYEDIITLGKALKEGDVAFSDESPKEEPDCPHDNVKLFQSGYKQCQDCKWIWRD
jgi:hypothetical protein